MRKVLIAGATGYLGRCALQAFKEHGYYVRALARDVTKLAPVKQYVDETVTAQVTRPETLAGICDGIDCVFSALGITKQKDSFTYMDVDYGGNKHLLDQALQASVGKFIYTSVFIPSAAPDIEIFRVKEKFVHALRQSGMDYTVMRPTGFFVDMAELFKMAKRGKAFIIGKGLNKSNPIDGHDLARLCVEAAENEQRDVPAGGPEVFTQRQAAELAFASLGTPVKIVAIPEFLVKALFRFAFLFMRSGHTRGALEFLLTVFMYDFVAPRFEGRKLRDYFDELARQ